MRMIGSLCGMLSHVEVAELVLQYLEALIWPAVVLTSLVLFRARLTELLGRITSFEGPAGVKANFGAKLDEVRQKLDEARVPEQSADSPAGQDEPTRQPDEPGEQEADERLRRRGNGREHLRLRRVNPPPDASTTGQDDDEFSAEALLASAVTLLDVAATSPEAAVLGGWRLFELFAHKAPDVVSDSGDVARALNSRIRSGQLSPGLAGVVHDLRQLRNAVAHGPPRKVTVAEAVDYVETVLQVIELMSQELRMRYPTAKF